MKYEIRKTVKETGRDEKSYTKIVTEIATAKRRTLDVIKYREEGKSKFTWIEIPNDYQMKNFYDSFEMIITEIKTGKVIYSIKK